MEYDPQEEARRALEEAGITEADVNEVETDGIPVALDLLIQCCGCLERGQEQLLRLQWRNDSGVALGDLEAVCPVCTSIAQAEAPGVTVAIPVVLATGQDAAEIDEALAISDELGSEAEEDPGALPPIDDGSHPFRGPATAERPIPIPVDE